MDLGCLIPSWVATSTCWYTLLFPVPCTVYSVSSMAIARTLAIVDQSAAPLEDLTTLLIPTQCSSRNTGSRRIKVLHGLSFRMHNKMQLIQGQPPLTYFMAQPFPFGHQQPQQQHRVTEYHSNLQLFASSHRHLIGPLIVAVWGVQPPWKKAGEDNSLSWFFLGLHQGRVTIPFTYSGSSSPSSVSDSISQDDCLQLP